MSYKCSVCGGNLETNGKMSIITCPYCNTIQTLPILENGRQSTLYDLANHFMKNKEYDKAAAIYAQLLSEKPENAGMEQKALYEQECAVIDEIEILHQTPEQNPSTPSKHIFTLLESGDWDNAVKCCDIVLQAKPDTAYAYVGKLMADLKIRHLDDLAATAANFEKNINYQKALTVGDQKLKSYLRYCSKESVYSRALKKKQSAKTAMEYREAKALFESLGSYSDAQRQAYECEQDYEQIREYQKAVHTLMNIWKK